MSVPFVSYHAFMKYYAAELRIHAYFIKSCFERLCKIVSKFLTFLKNCVPKFSKKNTGCSDVHVIERPRNSLSVWNVPRFLNNC
jgi:hypothetical protein